MDSGDVRWRWISGGRAARVDGEGREKERERKKGRSSQWG